MLFIPITFFAAVFAFNFKNNMLTYVINFPLVGFFLSLAVIHESKVLFRESWLNTIQKLTKLSDSDMSKIKIRKQNKS